ncbi:MAG: CbtB-domain containing protein [Alphaproteobacteria bacterium]|jgi:cobalt transporter subunit CbtB|nr:CbtB-domain containing protein [Alphaproteobacteria bacterium]
MAQIKVSDYTTAERAAERVATTQVQTAQVMQAGFAALLGMALFIGVAFSHPTAIHNAAHDGRHGIAVPCH